MEAAQLEGARALGFSWGEAMRLVIVPQGIRRVLPAWVNQLIALIKDSSLVYFLGLLASQRELFRIGQDYAATTGNQSAAAAGRALLPGADRAADPRGQLRSTGGCARAGRPPSTRRRRTTAGPTRCPERRAKGADAMSTSHHRLGEPRASATCTWPSGANQVLRGVDLDVPGGATACVIGPSGSGKSTLLRTINRLIEPDPATCCWTGAACCATTRTPCGSGSAWCSSSSTSSRT